MIAKGFEVWGTPCGLNEIGGVLLSGTEAEALTTDSECWVCRTGVAFGSQGPICHNRSDIHGRDSSIFSEG